MKIVYHAVLNKIELSTVFIRSKIVWYDYFIAGGFNRSDVKIYL